MALRACRQHLKHGLWFMEVPADEQLALESQVDQWVMDGILRDMEHRADLVVLESNVIQRASEVVHAHARDANVHFQEAGHVYYLHTARGWIQFPISVSGVWSSYFDRFNAEDILTRHFDAWAQNPSSKYWGQIREMRERNVPDEFIKGRIQKSWADAGVIASSQGTRMHREIEFALRGEPFQHNLPELRVFQRFVQEWLEPRRWVMRRVEWTIYEEQVMVAGQIDAVFQDASGALHMLDWKRTKHSLDSGAKSEFGRYGHGACSHLVDNEYHHYALQQNLYSAILGRNYGIRLASMSLVQIHPDYATYTVVAVPAWPTLAHELLDACGRGCMPRGDRSQL